MNNTKKIFVLCLSLLMCLTAIQTDVRAVDLQEARRQQQEIRDQISDSRRDLNLTRSYISSLNEELAELEYALAFAVELLETVRYNLETTRLDLEYAQIELEIATEIRDRQFDAFVDRARHIYMNGWSGYIDAILNATSFTDLLNQIDRVNRIVQFDRNMVNELMRAEENIYIQVGIIQTTEAGLLFLEAYYLERMRGYDELLEQKIAARIAFESTAAGQAAAIAQMEEDARAIGQTIQEEEDRRAREEAARRLEQQQQRAAAAARVAFVDDGIGLLWPLPGITNITSPFGNRRDPFHGGNAFHSGVDVGAPMGTNILAANDGRVIFAGWQGGYGNTVIIDHGNGMHTMYAHASSLMVRNGQYVNRGQVIARVGSTGRSTGNHLHFEVRINGSVTNPLNFTTPR